MIHETITELKEILLGHTPRKTVIESIIAESGKDETYPSPKTQEDPMVWYQGLALHLIHLMYHGKMDAVEALRHAHQIPRTDLVRFAELAVDFFFTQNKFDSCLLLADYCTMDPGRVTKIFLHFFREYLAKYEFEKAGKLWEKFREKGVQKQVMYEEVKQAFKRVTEFRKSPERRNYEPMFRLVELFDIPKAITHWAATEQYKYCMERRDYYTAALIAKKLNLHQKFSNSAAFESYKHVMNRVKDNISSGRYTSIDELPASDPLNMVGHLIEEFKLLDYSSKRGEYDVQIMKNIVEIAHEVFSHVVAVGVMAGNAPAAVHGIAVKLLGDFELLSGRFHPKIAAAAKDMVEKLISDIQTTVDGNVDISRYYGLLRTLRAVYTDDYARFDPIILRLMRQALAQKEVQLAGEINKDFSCPMGDTTGMVLERIHEWTAQEDFETVIAVIGYFPVQNVLKNNQDFMKSLRTYYRDTIAAHKYLKAITISEAFHLDRKYIMDAIRINVLEEIGKGNIGEIKNLIRKYRVHRREYLPLMQEAYLALLETNRETAVKLRNEFGIGIFEIGFLNWLLHEVMGINRGRNLEQKLADEIEKMKRGMALK